MLRKRDGDKCYLCGVELDFSWIQPGAGIQQAVLRGKPLATLDHVRPRSCGGTNSLDNLRLACTFCNNKKGNKIRTDLIKSNDAS